MTVHEFVFIGSQKMLHYIDQNMHKKFDGSKWQWDTWQDSRSV